LTDPGFDFSVLSEFRSRLLEGGVEKILLNNMLEAFQEMGLLKARGKRRTDSTHVLASIRVINRLVFVAETLRYALNSLSAVAPEWVRSQVPSDWYTRYEMRIESHDQPRSPAKRDALAPLIGDDGFYLLAAVFAPATPDWMRKTLQFKCSSVSGSSNIMHQMVARRVGVTLKTHRLLPIISTHPMRRRRVMAKSGTPLGLAIRSM
jgi:hypothetical protein